MGLLVDRLAVILGRLHVLQAQLINRGASREAAHLQHDVVERIQQVVLQIDGSAVDARASSIEVAVEATKVRFPRGTTKDRQKPGRVVWTCWAYSC